MKFWKKSFHPTHSSILAVLLITLSALSFSGRKIKSKKGEYKELEKLTDVLVLIENNYVEEVKTKDLFQGAIRGMMGTLDSHSSFMPPEIYKEMQVETRGSFGGLGIEITIRQGRLTVVAPIADTPASNMGIKALDWIVKVDDKPTQNMTLMEAVTQMRGKKGTSVTITIMRKSFKEPKDFTIIRDIIKLKNITYRMLDDDIGYIKLRQFQERSTIELKKSLKNLKGKGRKAIILDLRNNPGGLLDQSVSVAGLFLGKGKTVVSTKGRLKSQNKTFRSETESEGTLYPLVVLVNAGSASASEIVAGAIKDWKRGIVLGVKTFGKGTVQTVIPLGDGSGLRLTTAHYYTPNDTDIHAKGIVPDIVVDDTDMIMERLDKIKDKNKKQKLHFLREKDLRQSPAQEKEKNDTEKKKEKKKDQEASTTEKDEEPEVQDVQLERAKDVIRAILIFKQSQEEPALAKKDN